MHPRFLLLNAAAGLLATALLYAAPAMAGEITSTDELLQDARFKSAYLSALGPRA